MIIPDEETPPKSTATREAREAQGAQESAETPLTAAIHDAPESHDGEKRFTFDLRFSEDPKEDFSYKTLRDHAFTVTRGTVVGARRLDGDSDTPNIRWEISVSPGLQRGRPPSSCPSQRTARRRGPSAPMTGRCCPAR